MSGIALQSVAPDVREGTAYLPGTSIVVLAGLDSMLVPLDVIRPDPTNPRTLGNIDALIDSIQAFGMRWPVLVNRRTGVIEAGHQRVEALRRLGASHAPVIWADDDKAMARAFMVADNRVGEVVASWDTAALKAILDDLAQGEELGRELLGSLGFSDGELVRMLGGTDGATDDVGTKTLAERFMVPPFTVLMAREGWWQDRKRAWISLGIKSEAGRDAVANASISTFKGKNQSNKIMMNPTSIFDPVLTELMYRWFCPPDGAILDPFAGGSVRGVVAAKLGRRYTGIELRGEQVEANRHQWNDMAAVSGASDFIVDGGAVADPVWIEGDSLKMDALLSPDHEADFVFSCPPYADLEVYSDDPCDISNMPYEAFLEAYRGIIAKACARLKSDRFACFVVGEVRDKDGNYYNFVGDTVRAFQDAGLTYYNEAILVTHVGTTSLTTSRNFPIARKLGKTHQNVLVFVKGDPRQATAAIGTVDFATGEDLLVEE